MGVVEYVVDGVDLVGGENDDAGEALHVVEEERHVHIRVAVRR